MTTNNQDPCRIHVWPCVLSYPKLFVPGGVSARQNEAGQ
jgi:hypothetical protein